MFPSQILRSPTAFPLIVLFFSLITRYFRMTRIYRAVFLGVCTLAFSLSLSGYPPSEWEGDPPEKLPSSVPW